MTLQVRRRIVEVLMHIEVQYLCLLKTCSSGDL